MYLVNVESWWIDGQWQKAHKRIVKLQNIYLYLQNMHIFKMKENYLRNTEKESFLKIPWKFTGDSTLYQKYIKTQI